MTLIVGIGNSLRRDDGAGAAVAGRLAHLPDCRVLIVHQLVPEQVEEMVRCERVVFADAAVNATEVQIVRLAPSPCPPGFGHAGDPAWLLGLCEALHGRVPEAWLLTVPAHDLGFGEGLSHQTAAAAEEAVRALEGQMTK